MISKKKYDEYLKTIKECKSSKVVSMPDKSKYNLAWLEVAYNHFVKLRYQLDCIDRIEYRDHCEELTETPIITAEIIKHYKTEHIKDLREYISRAASGLSYLDSILKAELIKREKREKKA